MFAWFTGASIAIKSIIIAGSVIVVGTAITVPIAVSSSSSMTQTEGSSSSNLPGAESNSNNPSANAGPSSSSTDIPTKSPTASPTPSASKKDESAPAQPIVASAPRGLTISSADADWVALAWNAPSNTGTDALSSYSVYISTDGGASWNFYDSTAAGTRNYTIGGLSSATGYTFAVDAVTGAGNSFISNAVSHTTTTFTPSAPTNLNIPCGASGDEIDSGGYYYETVVCVTYSAPTSQGISSVSGYEAGFSVDEGSSWNVVPFGGMGSYQTITAKWYASTGIPASSIRMGVRAVNAYGPGPWASIAP